MGTAHETFNVISWSTVQQAHRRQAPFVPGRIARLKYQERSTVSDRVPQLLDYAAPMVAAGAVPQFRAVAFLFALLGIAFNIALIAVDVPVMHWKAWAYHDLMQDPRAFGREIDPATIATLRTPIRLWASEGLKVAAASFGLLLAIDLLCATLLMRRNPPRALHRLRVYGRWKPIGAVVTAVAFFWSSSESLWFLVAATRHWPLSSGPPYFTSIILLFCAWLPAWWVRKRGGVPAD